MYKPNIPEQDGQAAMYGDYPLAGLPPGALPDPGRSHRGEHSYTVVATQESSEHGVQTALIDVFFAPKRSTSRRLSGAA